MSLDSADSLHVFHGSPIRPERPAFGSKGNQSITVSLGRPFFVTEARAFAAFFARGGTLSSLKINSACMLDLTAHENMDRLLEVFNADAMCPDAPWDEDILGEVAESAYLLLESKAVWTYLVSQGIDAVRLMEQVHPRVESIAIINPDIIERLSTHYLSRSDHDHSCGP